MRKKNLIIIVMCVAICIMAVGYAAFNTTLTITGTSNITSEWNVVFTSITQVSKTSGVTIESNPVVNGTSATFDVGLALPGDKIVYEITIENKGTINAIIENIVASASDSPAIIFSMEGVNIGDKIPNKTSKTLTVTIEYDKNVTSQPEKTNKVLTVDMTVVQDAGQTITPVTPEIDQPLYEYSVSLSSEILKNNIAQADTNINFGAISSDTNGKGLYYTSTNTENNQITYYFRGAVDNNYVQFGKHEKDIYYGYNSYGAMRVFNNLSDCQNDSSYNTNCTKIRSAGDSILWRIVRINEDGSIRIITQDSVGNSKFNENNDDNAYVGYMYGSAGQSGNDAYNLTHSNDNPSTIKTYLDNWYVSNLSSYAGYLADAGFCNDRSVAPSAGLWAASDTALGYAKNTTYYGAAGRLVNLNNWTVKENAQPQFKCPNEGRDLFTTSSSTKGNKELTNPIGLITADEIAYAGGIYGASNESMYLTNGYWYWTMSPFRFYGLAAAEWCVDDGGYAYNLVVHHEAGVRPVANLRSGVEIMGGDGTVGNPYVIK